MSNMHSSHSASNLNKINAIRWFFRLTDEEQREVFNSWQKENKDTFTDYAFTDFCLSPNRICQMWIAKGSPLL